MKEVIYTCIFLLLLVILGVLVFFMFGPGKAQNTAPKTDSRYTPGIYRTSVQLNNNSFDLEVTVDADSIRSIHLANLSESTAAMFPLVEPVLDSLASQIYSTQSLENLDRPFFESLSHNGMVGISNTVGCDIPRILPA